MAARRSRRARAAPRAARPTARAVEDLHPEALGAARDRLADAAAADDPERRAGQVGAERRASGSHVRPLRPSRTSRSPSGSRRASASSSANARSAVASVSTSGVLPTGMPRSVGRLEVDVVGADGAGWRSPCRSGAASSSAASTRVGERSSAARRRRATRSRSSSGGGGRRCGPHVDVVRRAAAGRARERGCGG